MADVLMAEERRTLRVTREYIDDDDDLHPQLACELLAIIDRLTAEVEAATAELRRLLEEDDRG